MEKREGLPACFFLQEDGSRGSREFRDIVRETKSGVVGRFFPERSFVMSGQENGVSYVLPNTLVR